MSHHTLAHSRRATLAPVVVALLFHDGSTPASAAPTARAAVKAPAARVPGTIVIEGTPEPARPVRITNAFPKLTFVRPVYVTHPLDGTDRLFVVEQDGVLRVFDNRPDVARADVALDLRGKVSRGPNEEGLLGLAFHPKFKDNGHIYVMYSLADPRRHVVARFTMDAARKVVRPETRQILIEIEKPFGNHNGGMVQFGPDGYLYIAFGDGGSRADPHRNGQNLGTWLGKIHRIDVDRPDAGRAYGIPGDNPFAKKAGARGEIWAYGLRNPWRFSFDRETGLLYAGDVGQNAWEEIDLIEKGKNYGWNVLEGTHVFGEGNNKGPGPFEPPIHEYAQHFGRSVTGGYVYRGKGIPELRGHYVFGDFETGALWSLALSGKIVVKHRLLGRSSQIASFGEDRAGELYWTSLAGSIFKFERAPEPADAAARAPFPRLLSQTGLFPGGKPHPALRAYDVASPLWSDAADKRRWVMVPGTEKVTVTAKGRWEYPRGTIFVKEFAFGRRKLETRLMVHGDEGWAGYTYVWDARQKEAELIDDRQRRTIAGKPWTFPGRGDCMNCHTHAAGYVLGWKPGQLGGQLDGLVHAGYFATPVASQPAWDRKDARAYLDANCAHCHQPNGPGNASIDLRHEIPTDKMKVVGVPAALAGAGRPEGNIVTPGKPEASALWLRMKDTSPLGMPPLAHNVVDPHGLAIVAAWIRGLPAPPPAASPGQ